MRKHYITFIAHFKWHSQATHICALRLSWPPLLDFDRWEWKWMWSNKFRGEHVWARQYVWVAWWPSLFFTTEETEQFPPSEPSFQQLDLTILFPPFSLFLEAFEILPISLASSVIHVSCKDRSVIVVVSGEHVSRWSCLLAYKLVCFKWLVVVTCYKC